MPGNPGAPLHRLERRCDSCGLFDTHPRHVHHWDDGRITHKHMSCCRAGGCPDGSCQDIDLASGQARGAALVSFLHTPAFEEVVMAAASRGAPWAATAKAVGYFHHPGRGE